MKWANQPSATACGGGGAIARTATTDEGGAIAHSRAMPRQAGFDETGLWAMEGIKREPGKVVVEQS